MKATRLIFANGSLDPWHAISIIEDQPNGPTAIFIEGK